MVATRKGAWLYHGDAARKTWRADGPHFLGHIVNHLVLDPRDGRTLLAAAKTGHLGPTVFRSTDLGRSWKEAARPPAFAKAADGEKGRVVDHTFWLTPGHASEPDVWYAGTSPQGLFRSEDGGVTWDAVLQRSTTIRSTASGWARVQDGTPDGPKLHSIIVDPRDPAHLYFAHVGRRRARVARRRHDLDAAHQGLEVVEGFDRTDITFHDPHCVRLCPSNPDRLYQQNHCGIYRLDRPSDDVGAHRQEHAEAGRRHRLSDGGASARRRHRLGVPDGRHRRSGRAPAPTASPRSIVTRNGGKTLAAPRRRPAARAGVVDREAPGDDARTRRIPSASTSAPPAASCG